ncbi:uncharacterized protein [Periplaneta americana]|uniref:uncharacterized protein n=1 Tax=Periplaneta americana TaxID=6978 RepID=UPI0037E781D1
MVNTAAFVDNNINNSFYRAISSVVVTAQLFGLLPVLGISGQNAANLRFRWCSVRTIYSICILLGSCLNMIFAILLMKSGINFEQSDSLVFFGCVTAMYMLFLQLATQWPNLMVEWENLELSQKHYGYPKHLRLKIKIITTIMLVAALVEHILSKASRIAVAVDCTDNLPDMFRYYFTKTGTYNQIYAVVDYSVVTAILTLIVNFIATFTWNFTDLFIMLVSLSLAERFRLYNQHLCSIRGKILPESFWTQIREEYNSLSYLTRTVDSCVSKLVFVSFGSNLYFICRQLLNSLSPLDGVIDTTYFCWSFGFLLFRMLAMSLTAASIYDESRQPKEVLYSVPAENYQFEVSRLLIQIVTDTVALTGMNFFYVTRTLLLTLAGTIVTYEIVLVQFNNINVLGNSAANATSNTTSKCQRSMTEFQEDKNSSSLEEASRVCTSHSSRASSKMTKLSAIMKCDSIGSNDEEEFISYCECSDDSNSFHRAMSPVIVTAQCFGLLPVQGVTGPSAKSLRFKWKSLRVGYSLFGLIGSSVNIIFSVILLETMDLTFERTDKVVFYGTSAMMYYQFLQLARQWPELATQWEALEQSQKHYGYPCKLKHKIQIATTLVLIGALVEHCLSHHNILRWAALCSSSIRGLFRRYFTNVHKQMFAVVHYNIPLAAVNSILNIIATFTWNFTDLFIMLISVALAERFRLLNQHLDSTRGKYGTELLKCAQLYYFHSVLLTSLISISFYQVLPESYWHRRREEYNSLSTLTKKVDFCVSKIVLVSFTSNLYFICRQLLSSITPLGNIYERTYFYWSFGFVLFRTLMVSLTASRIFEESQHPREALFAVPSESYSKEVSRLLQQVTTDNIVITGMNFFSVTRTMLLTLVGTIVTYEIVLIQFNNLSNSSTTDNSTNSNIETNMTDPCQE